MNIIQYLFVALSYLPQAYADEMERGTVAFALRFWKANFLINFLYCVLAWLFYAVGYEAPLSQIQMGLWPIMFFDMVTMCYKFGDQPAMCCFFPLPFTMKYYPLFIAVIFFLILDMNWSILIGVGLGYLDQRGHLGWINNSSRSIQKWQNRFPFKMYKDRPNFVKVNENGQR